MKVINTYISHRIPTLILLVLLVTPAFLNTTSPLTQIQETILSPSLQVTAKTDKESYLLRQKVAIEGNITKDGSPATDLVVIIQAENPRGTSVAFRTLTIGNPTQTWPLNITNLFLMDMDNKPINTAKIGTQTQVGITIYNWQTTKREAYATVTIFDANMVPLRVAFWNGTIDPLKSISPRFTIYIEKWACSGKALITGNVYSKEPKDGGMALSLEKNSYFCISKTQQGLLEYPELPPPPPQTTPGIFTTDLRVSPEPIAGQYTLHLTAQTSPIEKSTTTTTFTIQNSAGYPPQASFAYWPAAPYENQTVQFDASSSTAEGFNDTIIKYEWDFGDGTPKLIKEGNYTHPPDPTVTRRYINTGQYIITLNVTDNERLWSTTSKPITIYPEFGPTANFTWTPTTPIINETVTFDASNSTLGWSKTKGDFSPITSYTWNFSDGTGNITVITPQISRNFTQPGNYTVTLTVLDDIGRSNSVWAVIEVLNVTLKQYDLNGDGKIDGRDITIVAWSFGSYPGHPRWNPVADVNKDDKVDGRDITPVAKYFGKDP